MSVLRWRLQDPADPAEVYTFPRNPNKMSSPFPSRMITTKGTTALDGQVLLWEGVREPKQWSFGGHIKDAAHYEDLRSWVFDRQGRLFLWDHFGRRYVVVLKDFDATPPERMKIGRYWHHTYEITGLVISVSAPTVGDAGYAG